MAHLVTGYAGKAHIKSSDDGAYNAAFFGSGQYVMESGNDNCFAGSIIDNNTVRILDGEGLMYGRHFRIEPNTYEDMTIETGTTGMNRIDLICMTYEKNTDNETETAYLEVIKGTETSGTAVAPEYTNGNILQGASFNQMPLYKVNVKGVVLSSITKMFATLPNYEKQAEVYYQKHEQLAEEYYEKYEEKIDESVAGLIEIPSKVTAQVELNTTKLEALADLGSGGISQRFGLSGTLKTGEETTVFTFDSAKTDDLLEENAWYSWKLKSDRQATGMSIENLTSCGIESTEHIVGYIELLLRTPYGVLVETQYCPFIPTDIYNPDYFIEVNLSGFGRLINKRPDGTYLNGFGGWYITARPYVYEKYNAGENSGVTWWYHKELNVEINLNVSVDFTAIKTGYDMSTIPGGGELPEIDYTELDNKPTINGVVVEGDLTSADLGLSGGSGGSGAASLTDLGVEATAEELNYMTNVTGDVQTQLDNKAESNHSHSGYATTATTDSLAARITTLESGTSFVFSDTEPETVAENTVVFVYETEATE